MTEFTEAETTLRETGVGDEVNLEIDVIARYVERLATGAGGGSDDLMEKLRSMEER